jgi:3-oxoacyl-[acyl-carrier protein] reductase
MDLGLAHLNALITGASRGLGFATAKLLCEEGANVCINGRDEGRLKAAAEEIKKATQHVVCMAEGDVTKQEDVRRIIAKTVAELGGLDLLVTNSGGPPAGKFEDIQEEQWIQAIELNFVSHVRLIKEALPYLKKSKHASVLTITSYSVKQPIPQLVLSNSIRAATVGLTKSLALELGNEGIRFNSIMPGWTKTERVKELITYRAQINGTTIEEEARKIAKESSLGRMAEVEEFARVAVFIISPAASYLTGAMISVDGVW